jgi:hypothetical protein
VTIKYRPGNSDEKNIPFGVLKVCASVTVPVFGHEETSGWPRTAVILGPLDDVNGLSKNTTRLS